jgi:hypothetical protein
LPGTVLKQQHADGGWSNWKPGKLDHESDAFATGMALYTLGTLGYKHDDANVQRGLAYLLKTQQGGDWTVTNAGGKAARIWTYWGTSWAMVGLAEYLPEKR